MEELQANTKKKAKPSPKLSQLEETVGGGALAALGSLAPQHTGCSVQGSPAAAAGRSRRLGQLLAGARVA